MRWTACWKHCTVHATPLWQLCADAVVLQHGGCDETHRGLREPAAQVGREACSRAPRRSCCALTRRATSPRHASCRRGASTPGAADRCTLRSAAAQALRLLRGFTSVNASHPAMSPAQVSWRLHKSLPEGASSRTPVGTCMHVSKPVYDARGMAQLCARRGSSDTLMTRAGSRARWPYSASRSQPPRPRCQKCCRASARRSGKQRTCLSFRCVPAAPCSRRPAGLVVGFACSSARAAKVCAARVCALSADSVRCRAPLLPADEADMRRISDFVAQHGLAASR